MLVSFPLERAAQELWPLRLSSFGSRCPRYFHLDLIEDPKEAWDVVQMRMDCGWMTTPAIQKSFQETSRDNLVFRAAYPITTALRMKPKRTKTVFD
jgi:hypothetical protein